MSAATTKTDAAREFSPRPRFDTRHSAFRALLSLTFLLAWWSLGSQVQVLIGSRGLLPASAFAELGSASAVSFFEAPTLTLWFASDAWLTLGCWLGAGLSLASLLGVMPRLAIALSAFLYLSYAVACREFLSFQWDNLLLECALLIVLTGKSPVTVDEPAQTSIPEHSFARWRVPDTMPPRRRVWNALKQIAFPLLLFRLLLFKLYFESGLAKYQSHLGDWIDGSAMTVYYETAPLPTPLAYYAHALPTTWHHIESWMTLCFELLCPFLIFGPRRGRVFALVVFSGFQAVNILTANYGFFAYLSLALGIYLLDERDVERAVRRAERMVVRVIPRRLRALLRAMRMGLRSRWASARKRVDALATSVTLTAPRWRRSVRALKTTGLVLAGVGFVGISLNQGLRRFVNRDAELPFFAWFDQGLRPFRLVNTYHLFAHITRDRIEPEFQVLSDGNWIPLHLPYKPGPVDRSPSFVAPHQPRLDFRLWFYGLGHRRGLPRYVGNTLHRICADPEMAAEIFNQSLPQRRDAARVVFFAYRFTSLETRARSGAVWEREPLPGQRALDCERARISALPRGLR